MRFSADRQEAAAAWFAAQRRAVMSLEEREAFDAWRADPENLAALNAMHELWGEMAVLKDAEIPRRSAPSRRWRAVGLVAASVVAVAGGFGLWAAQPLAFAQSAKTTIGEQTSKTLPDGSVVSLNVDTKIDYKMHDHSRDVRLQAGQALFVVQKDKARPFKVRAGDYEVRAVGTAFDVRLRDGDTQVAVQEGVVVVTRLKGPEAGAVVARLKAGERLDLRAPGNTPSPSPPTPQPIAIQSVAEWRTRTVVYEDASVAEVVEDLNRFFPQPIRVDDPALAARRVTLRLQVADRESTLRTLDALLGAQVDRSGDAAARP